MTDIYKNFKELSDAEIEGVDYQIDFQDKGTDFAIIGIHGGEIEPDTEVVVKAVAGSDLSYYSFLGNSEKHHITSIHFDEPECINLISRCRTVVSIHGKSGSGEFVMLGGLDDELIAKAAKALTEAGFEVKAPSSNVAGRGHLNVCNRGTSGKGLQIEMSRELRKALVSDIQMMAEFTNVIRETIRC